MPISCQQKRCKYVDHVLDDQCPLSAYLADKYMLGEVNEGWEQVEKIYQESDREEFFASLEKLLYSTGYIH
ncbi:hypothetical protein Pse7429DRAFT_0496 [Pseudanabaena biceps PCC 7429]|nr:hypothetical protein Pse7429DRAFT_0496 [Pseudanabaena biceps PCC 7429]